MTSFRRYPRRRVSAPATLQVAGLFHQVVITDSGRGGVAVRCAPFMDVDWLVDLEVATEAPRRRAARVAWRRDCGDEGFAVGLEFVTH